MTHLLTHPLSLRGLYAMAMARAFLRYRNPRRKASGRNETAFYEQTWREAAEGLGATWTRLAPDMSEIALNGTRTRVYHNVTEIDDPVTLAILHDKPLTHRLLSAAGLPVPRHAVFSLKNIAPAVGFLKTVSRDCVVKPAGGTGGGRGVTTGIQTAGHLARAAAAAAVYADELLIEEQIAGDNYRLLYLDGQLIDSFHRGLPRVVGDGARSISQLIDQLNDERLRHGAGVSQVLLSVDLDLRRTLAKQGLTLRSVPAKGQTVTLKTVVNENAAADNTTATPMLCPAVIEAGARAARVLGARFAGIDLVTPDPSIPLAEAGGVILEVNGTPNLYYHYKKADGAFPVCDHLLRRLLPGTGESSGGSASTLRTAVLETSHA